MIIYKSICLNIIIIIIFKQMDREKNNVIKELILCMLLKIIKNI